MRIRSFQIIPEKVDVSSFYIHSQGWQKQKTYHQLNPKQSGTKPNLVAKILATKIGNLSA